MNNLDLPKNHFNIPEGSGLPEHCYTIPPEGEYVLDVVMIAEMVQEENDRHDHGIPENAPLVGKEQPTKHTTQEGRCVSID